MSTDTISLFDKNEPAANPKWLLDRLADRPELAEVVARYRHQWRVQDWTCGVCSETGEEELLGPGGFWFRFRPSIVEAYHLLPFHTFAGDEAHREPMRQVWRIVAGSLGSRCSLYTHELMPFDGETLCEIDADLRKRIGPPAESFDQLRTAEFWGKRSWLVDSFLDMPCK